MMRAGGRAVDVVIVGGGLTGLAIAHALTARGVHNTLVLEREAVRATPHSPAPIRCHIGPPAAATLAHHSLPFFRNAAELLGHHLDFQPAAHVVATNGDDARALTAEVAVLRTLGIDTRIASAAEITALHPDFAQLQGPAVFACEPHAALVDSGRTRLAYAHAATRAGADIRPYAPVAALRTHRDRITGVRLTDGQDITAATVVVAAGPATPLLLSSANAAIPLHTEYTPTVRLGPTGTVLTDRTRHPAHGRTRCTATPDHIPALGPTGPEGLFIAAGFGAHTLATAPAAAALIADLLCDGASSQPAVRASDFRPGRFPTAASQGHRTGAGTPRPPRRPTVLSPARTR